MYAEKIESNQNKLTKNEIKKVLTAAQQVPTGDNCQHWKFKFQDNKLFIFYDHERGKHILNDFYSASLISLGTLVESVKISCSVFNIGIEVEYYLNNLDEEHWATIRFYRSNLIIIDPLSDFLFKRETNRRAYKKIRVPYDFVSQLQQEAEKYSLTIIEKSRLTNTLKSYLKKCDIYIFKNILVFIDTMKWVRFSKKETIDSKDGFNLKNLNLNFIDGLFIKLGLKLNFLIPIFLKIGLNFKMYIGSSRSLKFTGSFIGVTGKGSIYDLVNTGRISLRCWLELTKIGYSLQPLSVSCLLPYDLRKNGYCRRCPEDYIDLFNKSHDLFKENFNFPPEDQVLWFFRTGLVKPLTNDQKTLRLPIEKSLEN